MKRGGEICSQFVEHDRAVHAAAIRALRSRTVRRLVTRSLMAAAGGVAIAALVWQQRPQAPAVARSEVSRAGMHGEPEVSVQTAPKQNTSELTDEQLLAVFPPGSCFIAEVNGKKTLVFHDPALRAHYF